MLDVGPSELQKFYSGSTVFLTGATGFLGKLVLEKLLRTCSDIKRIYILVRSKRGKSVDERFEEIFSHACFDRLKEEFPEFRSKILMISGDCSLPNLAICNDDRAKIIAEVEVIIHCAATVRFAEELRIAANINSRAVRDLVRLCRHIKKLKAMVHVSTAYSQCPQTEIEEKFYDGPLTVDELLALVEKYDDKTLNKMTPKLLGEWPNTYTFAKAVTENMIKTEGQGLPIAIVRPATIISTAYEPMPGWVDNYYGPMGTAVGVSMGLLRTFHCNIEKNADLVPADFVINACLAAAWDVGVNKKEYTEKDIKPIYNYVSSPQNPITWKVCAELSDKNLRKIPSPIVLWHGFILMTKYKFLYNIYLVFLHFIPALIVDTGLLCLGKKPLLWKAYKKIHKFMDVNEYYAMNDWKFSDKNVQALWKKLPQKDKDLFAFDMAALNWEDYFPHYAKGGRLYLLKDPLDTIPQGRVRYRRLLIAHYSLVTVLLISVLLFFLFVYKKIFM